MGNPRRDALEYSVLITLTTSMAAAYAYLIAYSSQANPDGTRRKLPKVNLDDTVDLASAWENMKKSIVGISWGQSPSSSANSDTTINQSSDVSASSSSGKEGEEKWQLQISINEHSCIEEVWYYYIFIFFLSGCRRVTYNGIAKEEMKWNKHKQEFRERSWNLLFQRLSYCYRHYIKPPTKTWDYPATPVFSFWL